MSGKPTHNRGPLRTTLHKTGSYLRKKDALNTRVVKIYSVNATNRKNSKTLWYARPEDSGGGLQGVTGKSWPTPAAAIKAIKKAGYKNIKS